MALRLSTAFVNKLMGTVAEVSGTTIALVAASNTVTDSGSTLLEKGFRPGDIITIAASGTPANNGMFTVTSVETDGSEMVISAIDTNDSANADLTITGTSKGWKDAVRAGTLHVYTGSQPANADAAETGSKLLEVTKASGAFTKGTSTNGLVFDAISAGKISKHADVASGVASATGTAGWFRWYDNALATGLDESAECIRFDGAVGTSGGQMDVSTTSITSGATTTVDQADFTLPLVAT